MLISVHRDPAYYGAAHVQVKPRKHKLYKLFHDPLPPGVKCKCPMGRLPAERVYATVFDSYRGRVEKIFSQITHHRMFKGKNHLSFDLLVNCVHITLHTTAQWTRDNPQYEGYGDWSHFKD